MTLIEIPHGWEHRRSFRCMFVVSEVIFLLMHLSTASNSAVLPAAMSALRLGTLFVRCLMIIEDSGGRSQS